MQIIERNIADLIRAEYNPRELTQDQEKQLSDSLRRFGVVDPVIVNVHEDRKDIIIGGHQRSKVWQKLGNETIPTVELSLTLDQEKELNVRLNKNTGQFDMEMLKDHFETDDLIEWGFTDVELEWQEDVTHLEAEEDDFEVPDEVHTDIVQGDLIEIGPHRLLCGDSTNSDDVERLMDGQKADMVFTSPPYNANTKSGQGDIFNRKKSVKLYSDGYSDNLNSSDYVDFSKSVLNNCFLFTDGFIFWNVSYNANSRFEYIEQIQKHLQFLIEQICWKKSSTIPFKGSLMRDWEPIYIFSTNGNMLGLDSVNSNYWEVNNTNSQQDNHKACFPIELPFKAINLKEQFKIILEPFLGSGSTMVASHQLNRKCYGMELDPKYCQVIVDRMMKLDPSLSVKINGKDYGQE